MLDKPSSSGIHQHMYLRKLLKARTGYPIVVINCGVLCRAAVQAVDCPFTNLPIWNVLAQKNITAMLFNRILALFSSVIVYFVSDLGGMRTVAEWLAYQATSPPATDIPVLPYILLVMETTSDTFDESIAASRVWFQVEKALQNTDDYNDQTEAQQDITRHFRDITVLGLRSSMSISVRARAFKKRLLALSEVLMRERYQASVQFNFAHFQTLTKLAITNYVDRGTETLLLSHASRPRGFSTDFFPLCVKDFLNQMLLLAWIWLVTAPLVASALLLSSYPPGAHSMLLSCCKRLR